MQLDSLVFGLIATLVMEMTEGNIKKTAQVFFLEATNCEQQT